MTEPWLLEQQNQRKKEGALRHKPLCTRCGNRIDTAMALYLEGEWYCQRCVRRCTREVETL